MPFVEKTISSRIIYEGPVFKIRRHRVNTKDSKVSERDVLEHPGASVMIAILPDGRIILERQYRKAIDEVIYELPAGKKDPGETFLEAALRELKEETGFASENIEFLTTIYPSAGYSSERMDIFICTELHEEERNLDEDEDIDLLFLDIDTVIEMIENQEIKDAKTIAAILFARAKKLI